MSLFLSIIVSFSLSFYYSSILPKSISTFPISTPILIVNLPPSSIDIVTDAPLSMQVNQAYIVKVSLIPKGQTVVSSLMIEKASATTTDTLPVGTPGTSLKNAFGLGYEPYATATLSPNEYPLDITPIQPVERSLRQQKIEWKWSVIVLISGTQFLDVDIEVTWKSASGIQQGPYRIGDKQFHIDVTEPVQTPTATPTPVPPISVSPIKIDLGAILNSLLPYIVGTGGLIAILIPLARRHFNKSKASRPRSNTKSSNKKHKY